MTCECFGDVFTPGHRDNRPYTLPIIIMIRKIMMSLPVVVCTEKPLEASDTAASLVNPVSTNGISREGREACCNENQGNKSHLFSQVLQAATLRLDLTLCEGGFFSVQLELSTVWKKLRGKKRKRNSLCLQASKFAESLRDLACHLVATSH